MGGVTPVNVPHGGIGHAAAEPAGNGGGIGGVGPGGVHGSSSVVHRASAASIEPTMMMSGGGRRSDSIFFQVQFKPFQCFHSISLR